MANGRGSAVEASRDSGDAGKVAGEAKNGEKPGKSPGRKGPCVIVRAFSSE